MAAAAAGGGGGGMAAAAAAAAAVAVAVAVAVATAEQSCGRVPAARSGHRYRSGPAESAHALAGHVARVKFLKLRLLPG